MFNNLVESKPKKNRRAGGTIFSFIAHYGLILFVITFIVLAIARYMLLRIEKRVG